MQGEIKPAQGQIELWKASTTQKNGIFKYHKFF